MVLRGIVLDRLADPKILSSSSLNFNFGFLLTNGIKSGMEPPPLYKCCRIILETLHYVLLQIICWKSACYSTNGNQDILNYFLRLLILMMKYVPVTKAIISNMLSAGIAFDGFINKNPFSTSKGTS